jgi:hypothetical protein
MTSARNLLFLSIAALGVAACSTTSERVGGAGVGAVAGAAVAGPVGAVVGGVGGAVTGPAVARSVGIHHGRYYYWRNGRRHYYYRHPVY